MSILSKQQQKYILSLHNKKYRKQFGQFIVEGRKSIEELIHSDFEVDYICINEELPPNDEFKPFKVFYSKAVEIEKISTLKSNNCGLAVVKMKANKSLLPTSKEWMLALDDIHDPGNLGTIIRLADWYGITKIVCSLDTVDQYNPKVIAATMGSFTRVNLFYTDLEKYFLSLNVSIFGAVLDGENVHKFDFPESGVLLIGSESHGIKPELTSLINHKITIPSFGNAESLNAAVATGIILDNKTRRM